MDQETGGQLSESLYGGTIYRIPAANMGELQSKLAKLNKRSAKLGTAPISLEVVSTEQVEERIPGWTLDNGEVMEWRTVAREYNNVIVHGETPMLNGWQFVATLVHDDEIGTAIQRVPTFGEELDLTAYRTADPSNCDHCGLDRRRRDTFVVYNAETGETKQVGRQCIKDFLGYNDALAVAKQLERIHEFVGSLSDEEYGETGGMRGPAMESLVGYLTHVAAMIRLHGWVSKAQAGYDDKATSVRAYDNMMDYGKRDKQGLKLYEEVTDEDAEMAKTAIEFNRAHWSTESSNEFEYNMALAFARDFFNVRLKGFVAYGVQAYLKDRGETLEREAKAQQKPSEWQGEVGKRQVFEGLTVTDERTLENEWTRIVTHLYTMIDGEGNVFKWFASNDALKVGQTYNLKATVKKHDEWKGTKQTVINRAVEV
jgi:hypothetical protein